MTSLLVVLVVELVVLEMGFRVGKHMHRYYKHMYTIVHGFMDAVEFDHHSPNPKVYSCPHNHFENWKRPNFRMDVPGFEP